MNPAPPTTSLLLDTITSALRSASGQFVYGVRFTVKPLGAGYQVDCMESEKGPIDAARACLCDAGLDVFGLGYGSLHVQAAQPLPSVPCFDEDVEEPDDDGYEPEYDHEMKLERAMPWM